MRALARCFSIDHLDRVISIAESHMAAALSLQIERRVRSTDHG
jgi:hypothetical protein